MTLCLYFLYETMGPSIFAGLAVMITLIPINAMIVRFTRRIQVKQMGIKVCKCTNAYCGIWHVHMTLLNHIFVTRTTA